MQSDRPSANDSDSTNAGGGKDEDEALAVGLKSFFIRMMMVSILFYSIPYSRIKVCGINFDVGYPTLDTYSSSSSVSEGNRAYVFEFLYAISLDGFAIA
ncbi:uncharacterized protein G2W53_000823 [Senna tora]|uniref:Uncharacterized protein n=1 Tax=Senna tora TaxID=362788 RepID=A0A834XG44_9FABA|nr:uncharacterized protein G2W53_000823 [Senna tora]